MSHRILILVLLGSSCVLSSAQGQLRTENFDQEPLRWEGVNNRGQFFPPRSVMQDFGYSPDTNFAGGEKGEVGGTIHPAGEPAFYGYRLPKPLTLNDPCTAAGKLFVPAGAGHFLLGFFNPQSLNEWRTPNTLVARINARGDSFHLHLEYCTSRWRCEAGVIGNIVRGQRIEAKDLPAGRVYSWELTYDPQGAEGNGLLTWALDGQTATCSVLKEHRADGATFTHFGLMPVLKSWDGPGQVWIDDVTVQGEQFDFSREGPWKGFQNRRKYETKHIRPRFDFGWSGTHFAGGKKAGELGGLIFRGDCREPQRMAAYGDRLPSLTLDVPLEAHGKVAMVRGVSDSSASIGFYHSKWSMQSNPAQDLGTPRDFLGINIEGPSSEGFFFYPVYRNHGSVSQALGSDSNRSPRILPDSQTHDWSLKYDPAGASGRGRISVTLDKQTCVLDLEPEAKKLGASFDRFGICTAWIDGNAVTAYFDDLQYTAK